MSSGLLDRAPTGSSVAVGRLSHQKGVGIKDIENRGDILQSSFGIHVIAGADQRGGLVRRELLSCKLLQKPGGGVAEADDLLLAVGGLGSVNDFLSSDFADAEFL